MLRLLRGDQTAYVHKSIELSNGDIPQRPTYNAG
jgi:hypothetical protein